MSVVKSLLISLDFKIAKNSNLILKNNLNIEGVVELASLIFVDKGVSCQLHLNCLIWKNKRNKLLWFWVGRRIFIRRKKEF